MQWNQPAGLVPVAAYYNPYCDGGDEIDAQPICQTCETPGANGTDGDDSDGGDMQGDDGTQSGSTDGDTDSQNGTDTDQGGQGDTDQGDTNQGGGDQGDANQGDGDQGGSDQGDGPNVTTATGTTSFDLAMAAFKKGDNAQALRQINLAAKEYPNNGDVHQLRSMIHFAMKNYKASAAAAHKALSGDTPWEWADVKAIYSSTATYTANLRSLEGYVAKNPTDKAALFSLAYQYTVLDHKDSAKSTLKKLVALEPRDKLAARLMTALDQTQG